MIPAKAPPASLAAVLAFDFAASASGRPAMKARKVRRVSERTNVCDCDCVWGMIVLAWLGDDEERPSEEGRAKVLLGLPSL